MGLAMAPKAEAPQWGGRPPPHAGPPASPSATRCAVVAPWFRLCPPPSPG